MKREEADRILHCAMTIGERMLSSGAEVGRVEDTICRICKAYGAIRVDVFSITSSIVTTMFLDEFDSITQTRRVSGSSNNLYKLDELNQLSRDICAETPVPDEIIRRLKCIENGKRYSFAVQLMIYALISGSFSLFFGGTLLDTIASAVLGALLRCVEACLRKASVNNFFTALLWSTAGGFLANLAVSAGFGDHVDLISIGNIMLFIPGISFTTSLRDMFSGDTITGFIRFCESLLLAVIVALGFTFANFVF